MNSYANNILGVVEYKPIDYPIQLNNKYTRLTAIVGIDDITGVMSRYYDSLTINIIADGNLIYTQHLKYGSAAVNIDVKLAGYKNLIIELTPYNGGKINGVCFDVLGAQFYQK